MTLIWLAIKGCTWNFQEVGQRLILLYFSGVLIGEEGQRGFLLALNWHVAWRLLIMQCAALLPKKVFHTKLADYILQ